MTFITIHHPTAHLRFIQANIMIDQNGEACLADFGLLTFVSDPSNSKSLSSVTNAGTTRWMSPELLYPEQFGFKQSRPTKESDCYALGMVILEVLSEEPPFMGDKEFIVMRKVIEGQRPERPEREEFTDKLWTVMEQCWLPLSVDRPTVEAVLECLGQVSTNCQPLPPISEDVKISSDESISRINWGRSLHFTSKPLLITREGTSEFVPDPPTSDKPVGIGTAYDQTLFIPNCYDRNSYSLHSSGYTEVWIGEHQDREVLVKILRLRSKMNLEDIQSVGHFLNFPTVDLRCSCNCVEVLQGSNDVENPQSSKRAHTFGRDNARLPPRNCI